MDHEELGFNFPNLAILELVLLLDELNLRNTRLLVLTVDSCHTGPQQFCAFFLLGHCVVEESDEGDNGFLLRFNLAEERTLLSLETSFISDGFFVGQSIVGRPDGDRKV